MNDESPPEWQRTALLRQRLWAAHREKHGPGIEAELAPLDRAGLVARLAAEGFEDAVVSGRLCTLDSLLDDTRPPGSQLTTEDLRSTVFDVLLLARTMDGDDAP